MTKYNFNVKQATTEVIEWIQNYFKNTDSKAIIGVSGGTDSSVVAKLCVLALGEDRVIGVQMPNGIQHDMNFSTELCEILGIKNILFNIKSAVDGIEKSAPFEGSVDSRINVQARIRMSTLYYVAQTFNGRVSCNCNLSEDWVGYSTLFGDAVGQFAPLSKLTKAEVIEIGRFIGLPDKFVEKTPDDGICGLSDEDKLGFTYATLDEYIRTGICLDKDIKNLIDKKHKANLFKMELMPIPAYKPSWLCTI